LESLPERRIVLVEDDRDMRNALLVLLKTLGYAPIEYASAERALSDATFEGAGCMLVDIHLPGMRGTDMVRQLRARGCDWPVVFTTGHDDERYRIESSKLHAQLLRKPFGGAALSEALDRAKAEEKD
jgi:FixJ family two-component response regulator